MLCIDNNQTKKKEKKKAMMSEAQVEQKAASLPAKQDEQDQEQGHTTQTRDEEKDKNTAQTRSPAGSAKSRGSRPGTGESDGVLDEQAAQMVARILIGVQKRLLERPDTTSTTASQDSSDLAGLLAPSTTSSRAGSATVRPTTGELRTMSSQVVTHALESALSRLAALTSDKLTWESGREIVQTVVDSWAIGDMWKYHIEKEAQGDGYLQVLVTWSIPMRRRPVPTATVHTRFNLSEVVSV